MTTTIDFKTFDDGYSVEILYDEHGDCDPREWCNTARFAFSHNRYTLANEADVLFDSFTSWGEVATYLIEEVGAHKDHIWTVWMIDHSGVALRRGSKVKTDGPGGNPFFEDSGGWDSGIIGFAFVTDESLAETGTPEDRIDECINAEIETYGSYINGEVYWWRALDPKGETIESCSGYIGSDEWDHMYSEGAEAIEWHRNKQAEDAANIEADAFAAGPAMGVSA